VTTHLLDIIARAAVWRAFHGLGPAAAAIVALACFAGLLWIARR